VKQFLRQIKKFNEMYKIPMSDKPSLPTVEDLQRFKSILQEELLEIDDIIDKVSILEADAFHGSRLRFEALSLGEHDILLSTRDKFKAGLMAELADWHGDMIIYCHTHAAKFGLPMDEILDVIMQSNFSKLGANGQPIYDERGKVLKGPNFFPPEPALNKLLKEKNEN
jgi:predicted HAD superfamily Cof-like phosphohydrolase